MTTTFDDWQSIEVDEETENNFQSYMRQKGETLKTALNNGVGWASEQTSGLANKTGSNLAEQRSYATNGQITAAEVITPSPVAPGNPTAHRTGRSGSVLNHFGSIAAEYTKTFDQAALGQGLYVDGISSSRIKQTEEGREQAALVQSAVLKADTAHINKDTKLVKRDTAIVKNAIAVVQNLQAKDKLAGEIGKLHIGAERIGLGLTRESNANARRANEIAAQEARLSLEGKPATVSFIDVNYLTELEKTKTPVSA